MVRGRIERSMTQHSTEPLAAIPKGSRVLVAVPAHNEERFIGSIVLKLRTLGYAVLVVDDGSTDATAALAEAAGATVVQHSANLGKAAAVRTAFAEAALLGVDALVLLDGDSQHDPAEIVQVLEPVLAGQADMVVGSRFAGVQSAIPGWRRAGQHALTVATNLGSGVSISDSQSGFRAFSARAIQGMRIDRPGFSVESEMQFQAAALKLRVVEVPIHVDYGIPAKRSAVGQGVNVVDGLLRLVAQHRPLLFFGVPGLLSLMAGLALGVQVVRIYDATLQLAVGYALITVLLTTVGVLTIFVGIVLESLRRILREVTAEIRRSRL
jgi:glycosyltransferase involved in cell wall biosynthesis